MKTCISHQWTRLEKIRRWFGLPVETHKWRTHTSKAENGLIFDCRFCASCGVEEVKANGPMGDRTWKPIAEAFAHDHEREWYEASR